MAGELNWTDFTEKNPLKGDEKKVLDNILKVIDTSVEVINTNGKLAFKGGVKKSSSGIYEIKLGITNYLLARKKITGKTADIKSLKTKAAKYKVPGVKTLMSYMEPTTQNQFEIYFWEKKGKVTKPFTILRISYTGTAWKPPVSAGARTSLTTEEQEAISLEIIKEVASGSTPRWKTFKEMYKKSKILKKIHPNLMATGDWWPHFETQFQYIDKLSEFPSASYNTFSHTKGFMQFISKLVTTGSAPGEGGAFKEFAKFAEKDSWNPADVWLITKQTKPRFDNPDKRNPGIKQLLLQALSTKEINMILRKAYEKRVIVGISLKKNLGYTKKEAKPQPGRLKFERVNLEKKVGEQKLPVLKWIGIKFDPSFDKKKGAFISKTSYLYFQYGSRNFSLEFKSNQGNKEVDITYEFSESGSKAQLGKVPKDRFTTGMRKLISRDYPHHDDYRDFDAGKFQTKFNKIQSSKILKAPTADWIKKFGTWWNTGDGDANIDWATKTKLSDGKTNASAFVANMEKTWENEKGRGGSKRITYDFKSYKNIIMYQMFDFLYCVALMHGKGSNKMKRYLSDLFYFAQKKGQKWSFGPFGKLY